MERTIDIDTIALPIPQEATTEPEKAYQFRALGATDIFPMLKIIKAIGLNRFAACFESDAVQQKLAQGDLTEVDAGTIGMAVMLEVGQVIIEGLDTCEEEVFKLLSTTSNLSLEQVKSLDLVTFAVMVIDFVRQEQFKDFFKAVSKLLK
ncbi:hypothetical protein LJC20_00505 [Eubacteriales bacterium OttesenSCG-928-M02]|nr:hypothetical protein [Eubacteriales bacterium OttesenSCG-928-M02]